MVYYFLALFLIYLLLLQRVYFFRLNAKIRKPSPFQFQVIERGDQEGVPCNIRQFLRRDNRHLEHRTDACSRDRVVPFAGKAVDLASETIAHRVDASVQVRISPQAFQNGRSRRRDQRVTVEGPCNQHITWIAVIIDQLHCIGSPTYCAKGKPAAGNLAISAHIRNDAVILLSPT